MSKVTILRNVQDIVPLHGSRQNGGSWPVNWGGEFINKSTTMTTAHCPVLKASLAVHYYDGRDLGALVFDCCVVYIDINIPHSILVISLQSNNINSLHANFEAVCVFFLSYALCHLAYLLAVLQITRLVRPQF